MFKADAIKFFGNATKVALIAGAGRSAVSQWKLLVPEGRAARLAAASNGALRYDPEFYDEYRAKRRKELKDENHQQP